MGLELKVCTQCGEERELRNFHKNRGRKEGCTPICRFCVKLKYRDPKKAESRAYGQARRRTPEGRYKQMQGCARYRKLSCELSLEEYCELIKLPCFYCSGPLPEAGTGLDRRDNAVGYVLENVVPCCTACNHIRGSYLTVEEMQAVAALLKILRAPKGELQ
jgi:hypothetical protein